jgi:hypothetical protein
MTHQDDQCLKLGRILLGMIRELHAQTKGETGYAQRTVTFPGGEVKLFIATGEVADTFNRVAEAKFSVQDVIPHSQKM